MLTATCLLPHYLWGQQTLQTDLSLPYLVRQPATPARGMPVLILMHGYGSNEADLFDLESKLPQNFLIVAVRAPMTLGKNSFQWFGMETVNGTMQGNRKDIQNSIAKVKLLVPAIIKKYHADATQVYLSGFSQGGMMSYELGLTMPALFKGIAPLSGKIFEALKSEIQVTPSLKHLKIFIGHGDADNRVNYGFAKEADLYLRKLGLNPVLHTYKGMQHSINEDEINDLSKWLQER